MVPQPDLASQRPEPVSYATTGDTCLDVISGIVMMLFIIAVWFWCAGIFG